VQLAVDGGYIVGGHATSFATGREDAFILKLDASGEINGCADLGTSRMIPADSRANEGIGMVTATAIGVTLVDNSTITPRTSNAVQRQRCYYAAASSPVVEYYHAALDHYFVTWMPYEIALLDAGTQIRGWTRTGYSFMTYTNPQAGTSPVCRYYIPPGLGDSHFFGRGTAECIATGQKFPSFVLEDPAFMKMYLPAAGLCPANTTPVYRVFSNRPDANHRYMTDRAVRDQMVAKGWLAEGDGPDLVVMCAPQ
jgi:hypothetical protein